MTSLPEYEELAAPAHAPKPASQGRIWAALVIV